MFTPDLSGDVNSTKGARRTRTSEAVPISTTRARACALAHGQAIDQRLDGRNGWHGHRELVDPEAEQHRHRHHIGGHAAADADPFAVFMGASTSYGSGSAPLDAERQPVWRVWDAPCP